MKKIVIINGCGGVGKDTFVEFCKKIKNVLNVSTVDKVKEAAKILVGWNGEKDEKARKLLVDLKQLGIAYNDAPTKYIVEMAGKFKDSEEDIMFIHIREPEEIEKTKKLTNAKTLLITNNRVKPITSNESDRRINEYNYDYYIENNGTLEELNEKAKKFLEEL